MLLLGLGTLAFLCVYWTVIPAAARRWTFDLVTVSALTVYTPASVLAVAVLAAATYALIASRRSATAAVVVCLVVLALYKYGGLPHPRLLGLSYAFFRLVHVAVDFSAGRLPSLGPASLLEYSLFAPAFLSGPIARYPDFRRDRDLSALTLDAAFWGSRRVLFGLVKKIFLADPCRMSAERAFASFPSLGVPEAWRALLLYSLGVYLDFSAYCDIALGIARLFGFRLPENFAWPYLASSITEFWRRWHITLSTWLRDYVFLPASLLLARIGWLRDRPLVAATLATLITMLACGLWHGDTAGFALWGLGHGVLLSGHHLYRQRVLGRLSAASRRALAGSVAYGAASTALTFLAVTLLWVLFRFPPAQAVQYYRRLLSLA